MESLSELVDWHQFVKPDILLVLMRERRDGAESAERGREENFLSESGAAPTTDRQEVCLSIVLAGPNPSGPIRWKIFIRRNEKRAEAQRPRQKD